MEPTPVNPGTPLIGLPPSPTPPAANPGTEGLDVSKFAGGKWKNFEEADKGVNELISTLTERNRENDLLKQRAQALESVLLELQAGPPSNQPKGDPFKALADAGVDVNEFIGGIRNLVKEELAPVTQGVAAQSEFEMAHPEFRQVQPEVYKFVRDNPRLAQRFNSMYTTDPYVAMEWALDRYREVVKKEPPKSAADNPTAAALPGSAATAGRVEQSSAEAKAELESAKSYYRTYGDMGPLVDVLVKNGLRANRG